MGKKALPRTLSESQAMAEDSRLRSSPQKLNLVAAMIRGQKVDKALATLQFSPKKTAALVQKVLKSAIANAENNHALDIDQLVVKEAFVGKSLVMKRYMPRAKGRAGRILKPFSKVRIIVEQKSEEA